MNSREPTISVIMPSFNHGRFVSEAISSVVNQTISDLELIIVDDCSLDGSREIIQEWMGRDSRIRAIYHQINSGIARTVNDGLGAAKGKYVCCIASDDLYRQEALEKALLIFDEHPECGAVIFDAEWIDERGESIFQFSKYWAAVMGDFPLERTHQMTDHEFFNELAQKEGCLGIGLISRSVIAKRRIRFDERLRYFNDNLFWLDLSHVCRFAYIEEPLYLHRIHRNNTYNTARYLDRFHVEHVAELRIILAKYWDDLDDASKVVLLKNLAKQCIATHDFPKAMRFLSAVVALTADMRNRFVAIFMLLFVMLTSQNQGLMAAAVDTARHIQSNLKKLTVTGRR